MSWKVEDVANGTSDPEAKYRVTQARKVASIKRLKAQ